MWNWLAEHWLAVVFGTSTAVLGILNFRLHRHKAKGDQADVRIKAEIWEGSHGNRIGEHLRFIVTSHGGEQVQISKAMIRLDWIKDAYQIDPHSPLPGFDKYAGPKSVLPAKLAKGDYAVIYHADFNDTPKVTDFFVVDSLGREWHIKPQEIAKFKLEYERDRAEKRQERATRSVPQALPEATEEEIV